MFDTVCALLLLGHAKGEDNGARVLNRCVTKAVQMARGEGFLVPKLSRKNVRVALEVRQTEQLRGLSNRPERDPALIRYPVGSPKRFKHKMLLTKDIPIIVVNLQGEEYLVDGNRRINYSIETARLVMQVYVCYVR